MARKSTLALYGNVAIPRGRCPDCKRTVLIVGGLYACCDEPAAGRLGGTKRMSQPCHKRKLPPLPWRRAQLEKQSHRCFYCDVTIGDFVMRVTRKSSRPIRLRLHWDHLLAFAYSQDNNEYNYVAACHVCNGIKSSRIFATLDELRIYVADRREAKGYV